MDNTMRTQKKKGGLRSLSFFFILAIIIILSGTTAYLYYQLQKISRNPLAAQITAQEEAKKVGELVGKLMLLPKNETPTIATVTDISKLKDQSFFKYATNGNKVLIYPNSKLAIIYDPKLNLIVNVGPVNFSQQQGGQTQTTTKTRIGLRNGTKVTGTTWVVEEALLGTFPDAEIIVRDQGNKTDYTNTVVVDLSGTMSVIAEKIATSLNARLSMLPSSEKKPLGVDILIIVGADKL